MRERICEREREREKRKGVTWLKCLSRARAAPGRWARDADPPEIALNIAEHVAVVPDHFGRGFVVAAVVQPNEAAIAKTLSTRDANTKNFFFINRWSIQLIREISSIRREDHVAHTLFQSGISLGRM